MPKIFQDNRKWYVTLTLPNNQCPHLFYPRNIHGCYIRLMQGDGTEDECNMDKCPLKARTGGGE